MIVYHGAVPSAFRDGRAILVDGQVKGSTFDARSDSLSTKCPSKYSSTSVAPTQ
jgi:cytochrome c-type biogenesis protein CcmE